MSDKSSRIEVGKLYRYKPTSGLYHAMVNDGDTVKIVDIHWNRGPLPVEAEVVTGTHAGEGVIYFLTDEDFEPIETVN